MPIFIPILSLNVRNDDLHSAGGRRETAGALVWADGWQGVSMDKENQKWQKTQRVR
jgi:hypothetical protein